MNICKNGKCLKVFRVFIKWFGPFTAVFICMRKRAKKFMCLVMFILSCGLAGFTHMDTSQYCIPVPIYPALLAQILLMHLAIN